MVSPKYIIGVTMFLLLGCGRQIIDDTIRTPENSQKIKTVEEKEVIKKQNYHFAKVGYTETGTASWYGPDFHGKATASGETYDMNSIVAAHKYLPLLKSLSLPVNTLKAESCR